jgi:hypothetical protein
MVRIVAGAAADRHRMGRGNRGAGGRRLRLQTAMLRVRVEKNDARTLYRAWLTLEVPGRMLVAQKRAPATKGLN